MWSASIHDEIAGIFAEHAWHAHAMQGALEYRSARILAARAEYRADPWNRKRAVLLVAQWRKANPERARRNSNAHEKRRRERAKIDPIFGEKYRAIRRETKKRQLAKNPEHWREVNRRNAKAYRDRKKAA